MPGNLGIAGRYTELFGGFSLRRCDEDLRSVAVAVEASRLERPSLYPSAQDDDGVAVGCLIIGNPCICNSREKRCPEVPGKRKEKESDKRARDASA